MNGQDFSPHAKPAAEIAELYDVEISIGLSTKAAANRLKTNGLNVIERKSSRRWWNLLLAQFSSIVVWLLAFAALVSFFTENTLEAIAILVVLVLNAAVGFAVEWRAGQALEALRKATKTTARVRREGREHIIESEELVTGDILIISAGDRIPADLRIFESANLRADESTLTGESGSVEKDSPKARIDALLAERHSMLYLGTTAVAGSAVGIVTATGSNTEIGKIGRLVAEVDESQTPLQRKLGELGRRLVFVVLIIAAIVLIAGVIRGDEIWLMLEVSISLAVAAVPEGLPAVTTLILALGVLRMARQNAIVRRLAAVETLGSSTVICTDKTGTLTENRMTVQEYELGNGRTIIVSGESAAAADNEKPFDLSEENLTRLLKVSILCNEAAFDEPDESGQLQAIGDPTETALLFAFEKFGSGVEEARSEYQKLHEYPFDSTTKRMITVLRNRDGRDLVAMKGAPAVVLDNCDKYISDNGESLTITDIVLESFLQINRQMADRALRVLAFADKRLETGSDHENDGIIENGFTFLGYAGMIDPPRIGVAEAISKAQKAGIRVVMMTGDQINTARAVAGILDLSNGKDVIAVHSSEMTGSSAREIAEMASRAHVFARVSPADKLRIVRALQDRGEIVAVTGDGVNDAPALKNADIGIAMGLRGTEVAKEASDIVLTDDNFKTIVKAIEGGRAIYANILKFVHMMFSHNLGEVLLVFVAITSGLPLPLLPLQILWINLVTDIFPALALAVEPPSPNTMDRKPHSPSGSMLSNRFMFLILWQGIMLAAIVLAAYLWALSEYGAGVHARTIALLSLVGVQLGHLFNCRSRSRSAFSGFFSNPYIFVAAALVVGLQAIAVYFSPLARILDLVPPNNFDYIVIGISIVLPIVIVEVTKFFSRRLMAQNA